jgi:hypothetical protein
MLLRKTPIKNRRQTAADKQRFLKIKSHDLGMSVTVLSNVRDRSGVHPSRGNFFLEPWSASRSLIIIGRGCLIASVQTMSAFAVPHIWLE